MSLAHWEDFVAGSVAHYGPRLITREEIVAFAAQFDPQPMHLDEEAARATMLGGLAASGWHTCCIQMRMIADGFVLDSSSLGSPSVDEVKWLKPVRPGDRLTVRATVLQTRASNTRRGMGLVKMLFETLNQSGERVMTQVGTMMLARRGFDRISAMKPGGAP
ncbi:MAG TPA: MaoC family dehydratase [Xanthobacteraceae bacterium]|nr:MaoC family dehydratase [Xanthobacteraceae bacterium]